MKRLKLPRTLANALLADLQSGVGEGLIGAAADVPISVYPCPPADFAAVLAVIRSRGETPFARYAHAATPSADSIPTHTPYQILLAADIKGVIILRAFIGAGDGASWQELDVELDHD
ncbi:MAG: hypothetical protein ACYDCW_10370 [Acidithiobacillus ferrivorans]